MSTRPLTTTSYAILGVLAMRSWSAYELTGYMSTSAVRKLWPRTESRLYAEPKNLVAHGLATAETEYTGQRKRTVYRITDPGREELARWLGEPAAPAQTADETLLKVFLADFGSVDDLRATVRRGVEDLRSELERIGGVAARIGRGEPLFPERAHMTALTATHALRSLRQRFEELRWLDSHIRDWDDTRLDDAKGAVAEGVHRERIAELNELRKEVDAFLRAVDPTD